MSFAAHLRRNCWELGFSALASACVGVCLAEGFLIPPALEGRFLPALLICLVLNIAAYGFSYTKKSATAGMVVLVRAAICAALLLRLARAYARTLRRRLEQVPGEVGWGRMSVRRNVPPHIRKRRSAAA